MLRCHGPRTTVVTFLALLAAVPAALAQAPNRQTVVAGSKYQAGGFTRFWIGTDYRQIWATPVSVEVLDLAKEGGGLTPVRRVGGQQTKGLALAGADGRSYTFRGLDKDASHLLDAVDPELKGTILAKLLDMLMAAQHPASVLVADLHRRFGPQAVRRRDIEIKTRLEVVERLRRNPPDRFGGKTARSIETLDGMKLGFDGGWILCRASGTEPILRIYCEMETEEAVRAMLDEGERFARGV